MIRPVDLLKQAKYLLQPALGRPRQTNLRRAVSTAYYALFHFLTGEASNFLVGAPRRLILRQSLRRAFAHGATKGVSKEFSNGSPSRYFRGALGSAGVPPALRRVADSFVSLQEARHEADYDHLRNYTRQEAIDLVEQAEQAIQAWQTVRGTAAAETYLVALLVQGNMRG